jgi:hypothetical protein
MPINVTIQQGDNLPLARLLNSGGVPPRTIAVEWQTEPTSVEDARPGLFPFVQQGTDNYEVLISPDPTCQQGVTYVGVLRGTVTDDNGNELVRDLDVTVTIQVDAVLTVSWTDLERDNGGYATVLDPGGEAGVDGWTNPASNIYSPITPITAPITDPTVVTDMYHRVTGEITTMRLTFSSYGDPLDWSYVITADPGPGVTVTAIGETGASNSLTYTLELQFSHTVDFTYFEHLVTVTATDGVLSTDLTYNVASVFFSG